MLDIAEPVPVEGAAMEASLGCITMHPNGKAEALFVDLCGKNVCPPPVRVATTYSCKSNHASIIHHPIGGWVYCQVQLANRIPGVRLGLQVTQTCLKPARASRPNPSAPSQPGTPVKHALRYTYIAVLWYPLVHLAI